MAAWSTFYTAARDGPNSNCPGRRARRVLVRRRCWLIMFCDANATRVEFGTLPTGIALTCLHFPTGLLAGQFLCPRGRMASVNALLVNASTASPCTGTPPPARPLPVQFADWLVGLHELVGAIVEARLAMAAGGEPRSLYTVELLTPCLADTCSSRALSSACHTRSLLSLLRCCLVPLLERQPGWTGLDPMGSWRVNIPCEYPRRRPASNSGHRRPGAGAGHDFEQFDFAVFAPKATSKA